MGFLNEDIRTLTRGTDAACDGRRSPNEFINKLGNGLRHESFEKIYSLEKNIFKSFIYSHILTIPKFKKQLKMYLRVYGKDVFQ